jgi:hypothetical protein
MMNRKRAGLSRPKDSNLRAPALRGRSELFYMLNNLDLKTIFAASDIESARLMIRKAECLHQAGVIDCAEKDALVARLARMIAKPTPCISERATVVQDAS